MVLELLTTKAMNTETRTFLHPMGMSFWRQSKLMLIKPNMLNTWPSCWIFWMFGHEK